MRLPGRSDEEPVPPKEVLDAEQPPRERRLFSKLLILVAVAAFAVAFVLENHKQVDAHFVFATATVSLIWLILLSFALGLLLGVLLPPLSRRRRRRH